MDFMIKKNIMVYLVERIILRMDMDEDRENCFNDISSDTTIMRFNNYEDAESWIRDDFKKKMSENYDGTYADDDEDTVECGEKFITNQILSEWSNFYNGYRIEYHLRPLTVEL